MRREGDVILKLGAEGGSLTLYGLLTKEGCSFTLGTYDCTPELIDEGPAIQRKSGVAHSWDAALELLDENRSWPKLFPKCIHPDFKTEIWAAVQQRLRPSAELIRWRELCRPFFSGTGELLFEPGDVIPYLGRKEKHWKEGRSAFEATHAWFGAKGDIPKSIRTVLDIDATFQGAKLEKALFEKQTKLDEYRGPSQTDVLSILRLIPSGRAVLGIEAKVREPFDKLVKVWHDGSKAKKVRLALLVERLGLDGNSVGELRYQLLHRTAATLIEAERHGAREAAMIVQSFCPRDTGFCDFQQFATALDAPVARCGELSAPIIRGNVRLRLGWAKDHVRRMTDRGVEGNNAPLTGA